MYPSVSLLCFPMSQSIFILSLCSPDDLQRRSLLIPSAPSLWSHYKPHIYLIEPAACLPACPTARLPAWTAAGQSVCEYPSMHSCVCAPPICTQPCVCTVLIRVSQRTVYYLTRGSEMSECKMSRVTYLVSWRLRRPAGQVQCLFSVSLTCTLPRTHTEERKINTLVQS